MFTHLHIAPKRMENRIMGQSFTPLTFFFGQTTSLLVLSELSEVLIG